MKTALSDYEAKLYNKLFLAGRNVDVAIADLWKAMYSNDRKLTPRERQQYVGSVVSRVNKKLDDTTIIIVPGQLKRTYRLTDKTAS